MAVTVNSGTEGKARGRMEGMETHRSPPTPVATACSVGSGPHSSAHRRAQEADSPAGLGTDGWKPTTAKAADTFTARDTGRIGQEHQGQGIGNNQGHQAHQATVLPRVHAHLQGDRGGDFISATTRPTPHKSTKVVAQPQQFKTGRVLKHAWRIRWQ